jgi:hypothetical protein
MSASAKPHPKPRVIDNPAIGELYANKLVSASFDGGAVVLTLGVQRMVPDRIEDVPDPNHLPGPPTVSVVSRIALSPALAVELVNGISGLLNAVQLANAQAAALAGVPSANKVAS